MNCLMWDRHVLGFQNSCGNLLRRITVLGQRWLALVFCLRSS
ncbi:MAG: hypothetical protein OXN89_19885 [Bryobacterales bacterium]|nr:hypothetical protein [Bryobacterales bacterium]